MNLVHKRELPQQQELHESKLGNKTLVSCNPAELWKEKSIFDKHLVTGYKLERQNVNENRNSLMECSDVYDRFWII